MQINQTKDGQIIATMNEEAKRIQYGTLKIEIKVFKGELTNMMIETVKSVNLNPVVKKETNQ